MAMDGSDEDLALGAAAGDGAAFAALAARHYDRVFRLGFRVLGDRAEAEDLAQEVMAALPGKLGGYRAEARFTTWLYRVTVNAAQDQLRRRATRARAHDGWGAAELARRAEADAAHAALDWLSAAMRRLPPELRETVALTLGEELTQAEAAEVLGIPEGTVAWRMSEVKKRLRALHAEEERAG